MGENSSQWWRVFFAHPDSLILSRFPPDNQTQQEAQALQRLVPLRKQDVIADICCGMGRHLLCLQAQGYQMVGLDCSPMMLQLAQRRGRRLGQRPQLVQGLAQALPFKNQAFDVVLNLFNSFGYLSTDEENLRVLQEAARCLKPGGRFFLDTRNKKHQILFAPYQELIRLPQGRACIMRCSFNRQTQRLESYWLETENPERVLHTASIRLYSLEELQEMLQEAGFALSAAYGGYDGHAFEGWERELLLLCHKR